MSDAPQAVAPPKVFVSYRKSDTGDLVTELADRLRRDLGSDNVFRDKDGLIAGQQWRTALAAALRGADAAVFLVGPGWAGEQADGVRRIDAADDPVAVEARHAVGKRARCTPIPVLVDRESPPADLPADVALLFDRHAVHARRSDLLARLGAAYQRVLVGIWETIRSRTPRGVLIIGDHAAEAAVGELVESLRAAGLIDARRLSRFAAGAAVVSPRRLRKAARKWPNVIVLVGDEDPGPTLVARLEALRDHPADAAVRLVGGAAAGTAAGFVAATAKGGSTVATTAQLTSALPQAGHGLFGGLSTAWSNAVLGAKVAVAGGAVVVAGAAGVAVTNIVVDEAPVLIDLGRIGSEPLQVAGSVGSGGVREYAFTPSTEQVYVDTVDMSLDCGGADVSVSGPGREDARPTWVCWPHNDLGVMDVRSGVEYRLAVASRGESSGGFELALWPVPPVGLADLGVVGASGVEARGELTPGAVDEFAFTPSSEQVYVDTADMSLGCGGADVSVSGPGREDARPTWVCWTSNDLGVVDVRPGVEYRLRVAVRGTNAGGYSMALLSVPPVGLADLGVVGASGVEARGELTPGAVDEFAFTPSTEQVYVDTVDMSLGCGGADVSVSGPGREDARPTWVGGALDELGVVDVRPGREYRLRVAVRGTNAGGYAVRICPGRACR